MNLINIRREKLSNFSYIIYKLLRGIKYNWLIHPYTLLPVILL